MRGISWLSSIALEEPVPLSEEELRLLEQMERALVEEDPKFASTLRGTSIRRSARRRAIIAGACFAAGIVILMTGAVTGRPLIGVAGFVIMLGSATIALTAIRGQQGVVAEPRSTGHPSGFTLVEGGRTRRVRRSRRGSSNSSGTFLERMEERWRRRREQNGGF